jgi:hypothetical protein
MPSSNASSDNENTRPLHKRRQRDASPLRPVRQDHVVPVRERFHHRVVPVQRVRVDRVHPAERKRLHALRAFYQLLHEVRHEVRHFRVFTDELQREMESEWNDITPKYMMSKQKQFLQRMEVFGRCPLVGDVIGDLTYINQCGHVFNKVSLETANPKLESCPRCSKPMVYPFDF